ncbi:hypothetical protein CY35_16G061000 [Sphagnum magellanicum]|nr:hypothetical protein CY35_16G061000 [Sphagnum magellanicum]
MGKRGYHATGEKEELVCKVWEKKPQAGSNEEKCRDSVSPSPSPSISVWVQRLWKAMNSSCFCITAIILMFVFHSRTQFPSSWNLGLVSKSWGGDKCTLLLGCSNQNIFICKQEDHM